MLDLQHLHDLLQPIVGEPLSDIYRSVGQVFEFGEQRPDTNKRGEAITRGDFTLKLIAADWRIVQAGRVILGSSDRTNNESFFHDDEPSDLPFGAEAWRLGREFLGSVEEANLVVEAIEVGPFADVAIQLSNGFKMESFGSSGQDFDLWWFHNRRTDVSCLVSPSGPYIGKHSEREAPKIQPHEE